MYKPPLSSVRIREGESVIHHCRASDISRKKKQNFAGFTGANSRKNRPISRERSQNLPENRSISRDFSGKKSNFEGFSGANS